MSNSGLDLSQAFSEAARRASQSVVHVAAACRRGGSGSVLDAEGLVLTTARAVAGRERVELLRGEERAPGRVLGFDVATDIGIVRAESQLGSALSWSETEPELGALVMAASRPGRSLRVRLGTIAQVGDAWHTPRGARVERYVETSFHPEPGFSGGPVLDASGHALGLSAAGLVRGTPLLLGRATVERIANAIAAHGRVRRGYLGVGTHAVELPPALQQTAGQSTALLVSSVQAGTAADRAGLHLGDVLLALGDTALTSPRVLMAALEDAESRTFTLKFMRAGQASSTEVTPGARP
jgi:S1-C subfamily serine protease